MGTTRRIEARDSPELNMQKQRVHRKFHILSLEDPLKANAWRLKTACNRYKPKQRINTWQITEVSNSATKNLLQYGLISFQPAFTRSEKI